MGTLKRKTFASGKAAVKNARSLAASGQISKSELRGVVRSVSKSKKR
jgi:hypothetical protein